MCLMSVLKITCIECFNQLLFIDGFWTVCVTGQCNRTCAFERLDLSTCSCDCGKYTSGDNCGMCMVYIFKYCEYE